MKKIKEYKITPHLWFNDQAEEAANFYTSIFDNSKVGNVTNYGEAGQEIHAQEAGSVMTVDFELEGQPFTALNGGPHFTFTPAISFIVNCQSEDELDKLWSKLSERGKTLMPLDKYPFSEKYGWTEDKYSLSWQLILADGEVPQKILPSLMFVGDIYGKVEEAMNFYTSIFDNAEAKQIARYGAGQDPNKKDAIMFADFELEGQLFAAMESALEHDFTFNEAVSFIVNCENQQEIDFFWEKLSADPTAEQCGWLKDKYGVSWQIIPAILPEMLKDKNTEKSNRVMEALFPMKKLDINTLTHAYEQNP